MGYNGFFVDDLDEIYAVLLSSSGDDGLKIKYCVLDEAATLAGELFNARPDIVAVDFRLDENPAMIEPHRAYNGSGLAQLLRDKSSAAPEYDFPIVLISAEDKLERFYRPDGTAHDLFDRIYKKDEVGNNPDPVKAQLMSLCKGYKDIKAVWGGGMERLSVFGLGGDELMPIANQELRAALLSAGAPHIAARTILKGLIDRPGLLLSDSELSARLGVATLGPLESILIDHGIKYGGIFGEGWRRWWAHRFDDWARELFGARPTTMTGSARVKVLNAKFGIDVQSAVSTWNKSSDERFAFSCSVCDRPGEIRHSVAAFDPHAPKYSHRKRICWDCIQTGRYVEAKTDVDDVDANLVTEVMTKPRTGDATS
jgi:hypothetical protein